MSNPLPDERALRQMVYVAVFSFVIGFVGMLALFEWVILRFVAPEGHWLEILHSCITAILFSVIFGGLGFAALSLQVLNWYQYKRGYYRCRFCGQPLKGAGVVCSCPEAQVARK